MGQPKKTLTGILGGFPPFKQVVKILRGTRAPVFMLHRVLPEGDICYDPEMVTAKELFAKFLDWIGENFQCVQLEELVEACVRRNGALSPCAITFDDGWRDTYEHAYPLLRSRGMPATVFLAVNFVGSDRHLWQERLWFFFEKMKCAPELKSALRGAEVFHPWFPPVYGGTRSYQGLKRILLNRSSREAEEFVDRLEECGEKATPFERAFVNWDEVRAMAQAGIQFGSHTLQHTLLTSVDPESAEREIRASRLAIEEQLGSSPSTFSYPWGQTNARLRGFVERAGYRLAVTTRTNLVHEPCDPFLVPRLAISTSFLDGSRRDFQPGRLNFYLARAALRSSSQRQTPGKGIGDKVRIALVIDYIDSWEDGGTEKQLAKLIEALGRVYFEVELYFLRASERLQEKDFPCPIHVACSRPGSHFSRLSTLRQLVKLFRLRRPHIVQTFFRDATYYGVVAARLAGVPAVVISRRNVGYWKSGLDDLLVKVVNRMADSWQCNSRATFESLRLGESVPASRIEILPNAVDLDGFFPANREEKASARVRLGVPVENQVVVSVANLTPVKDPETLVEAALTVCGELPEAKFLIVGDGPLRSSLERRVASRGLSGAIRFAGTQRDVRTFLAAADIAVLTSQSEGSSNSLLEYMAMGVPVVVTDAPANRELVDGEFFESGNHADLAQKVAGLLKLHDGRPNLRLDYQKRVAQFSEDALARRSQAYYAKLAAGEFKVGGGDGE